MMTQNLNIYCILVTYPMEYLITLGGGSKEQYSEHTPAIEHDMLNAL